jgi:thiol:disulfide interchange protein
MTLSLVFRIQAVVMAFFGLMMLIVPVYMMESFGVESSAMFAGVMQQLSIIVLGSAYVSWKMPTWVGDNIKAVGLFFVIVHVAAVLITFYHMSVGVFPFDATNIGGTVPDVVLAILFLWKSRADP